MPLSIIVYEPLMSSNSFNQEWPKFLIFLMVIHNMFTEILPRGLRNYTIKQICQIEINRCKMFAQINNISLYTFTVLSPSLSGCSGCSSTSWARRTSISQIIWSCQISVCNITTCHSAITWVSSTAINICMDRRFIINHSTTNHNHSTN